MEPRSVTEQTELARQAIRASPLAWQRLDLPGAEVWLAPRAFPAPPALVALPALVAPPGGASWYARLAGELDWAQTPIRLYGREVLQPRLTVWHGDAGTRYRYSGRQHVAGGWPPVLADLRAALRAVLDWPFNSVLGNWYRDGRDYMGWHSDDEPELGPAPLIASLSFGASRRFCLRARRPAAGAGSGLPADAKRSRVDPADPLPVADCLLEEGSLLVMAGATQHLYHHALPKALRVRDGRINLTFRVITGRR